MQYWQRKLQRSVTEMRTSPMVRPWPSTRGSQALAVAVTGLPSGLVEQRALLDDDALLDALDHVVDRERADRRGRQRLHLDAGAGHRAGLRRQRDRAGGGVHRDVAVRVAERQRVAERDELRRP